MKVIYWQTREAIFCLCNILDTAYFQLPWQPNSLPSFKLRRAGYESVYYGINNARPGTPDETHIVRKTPLRLGEIVSFLSIGLILKDVGGFEWLYLVQYWLGKKPNLKILLMCSLWLYVFVLFIPLKIGLVPEPLLVWNQAMLDYWSEAGSRLRGNSVSRCWSNEHCHPFEK